MSHQMVTNGILDGTYTHYQVLGLPRNVGAGSDLSAQQLKAAYRRALFQSHPDKIRAESDSEHGLQLIRLSGKKAVYTIDQVTEAYATLSVPKLRCQYDRVLTLQARPIKDTEQKDDQMFHPGIEAVDLDDLGYDAAADVWFKSCRCGEERGFQIRELDLEEASDTGDLHVGCGGCSLWLKVLFGVVEEKFGDHVPDRG